MFPVPLLNRSCVSLANAFSGPTQISRGRVSDEAVTGFPSLCCGPQSDLHLSIAKAHPANLPAEV